MSNIERGYSPRTGPGNPLGGSNLSRRALVNDLVHGLLVDYRKHGMKAIERVRKTNPAIYLKCLVMLVPKEHKVEHTNVVGQLSDEQLGTMIAELEERLAAKAAGLDARLINGTAQETPASPAPKRTRPNPVMEAADTAIAPTTARYRKAARRKAAV